MLHLTEPDTHLTMGVREHSEASQPSGQQARCAFADLWSVELLPRRPYNVVYVPDATIIGFAFDSQIGVHSFASDRRTEFYARANSLAYVPRGCDVYSRSKHGGEYLKINVSPAQSDIWLRECRINEVIDPSAIRAAYLLRRMLLKAHPPDLLNVEELIQTLLGCVSRIIDGGIPETHAASWMTPRRLRLVDDLLESRMDEKMTVQEVAAALGLSAGFFSRAFRAAVGKAPHDYIIDRRISQARALRICRW